jgi:photosystem II stability/assembly factor-like uncharacterized protein
LANAAILALAFALLLGAAPRGGAFGVPANGPLQAPGEWMTTARERDPGMSFAQAFERARTQALAVSAETSAVDPALAAAEWEDRGPATMGGRVTDIAVDPQQADTLYIASASGGVWKSSDAGLTYDSIWPHDWLQGIGALAIASDGTLFAGTGEANPGGGSIVFGGNGVYRSRDRGATWEQVGLPESGAIGRILVDPTDPQTIFVAAAGNLFTPGGERGVYRSVDGGDTWELVLAGDNDTTGAVDLAIDPSNTDRVFATMWDHRREPDLRRYGGAGSGVYRTTDGGGTWSRLGGGLPAPAANIGRIGIAVAANLPNVVYAIVNTAIGPFEGFYKSVDGGTTWIKTSLAGDPAGLYFSQSTFGWWFGRLWVDPTNFNRVFVAGVSLTMSLDGGVSFLPHTGPHADQHAMAWDPKVPGRVYLGNDGGMYRHDNSALTLSGWVKATDQPFMQFYSGSLSQQNPTRILGGLQDNGCVRNYPSGWSSYCGGDGTATGIDPTNQDFIYGCSQYGSCRRSTNGGDTMTGFGSTTSSRRNWLTAITFDPSNTDVMYYVGDRVNRSTDKGATWTAISPPLSTNTGRDTAYPFGTATTVAVAPTDSNRIYVGFDEGTIWTTPDLGVTWTEVDPSLLPGEWVSRVAVDPQRAETVYATFSGFRSGVRDAHVMRSDDAGATWTDISGNLPDAPVNDVIVRSDQLLVGTDVGVFRSVDGGATWLRIGSNLPMAAVMDIDYHPATNTVLAATFGRGMWTVTLPS